MPTGLLLGAGFSYDLGMPLASEFTAMLFKFLNKERMEFIIGGMKKADPFGKDSPIDEAMFDVFLDLYNDFSKKECGNYEELFKAIEDLRIYEHEKTRSRDYFLGKLEDIIHESFLIFQQESYSYYCINRDVYALFFKRLLEEDPWIFTLNHDLCLEMLFIDYDLPFTHGADSEICFPMSNLDMSSNISFDCMDASATDLALLKAFHNKKKFKIMKLHGGLNEFDQGDNKKGKKRIFVSKENCEKSIDYLVRVEAVWHRMEYKVNGNRLPVQGEICVSDFNNELQFLQPSILTGSKKYSIQLKPVHREEKITIYSKALEKLDKLYILGYSFGDAHINSRLQRAMYLNDNLKVVIVDPYVNIKAEKLFSPFDYDLRVRYARASTPQWMDYELTQKWNQDLKKRLDIMNTGFRKVMMDRLSNIFVRPL